MSEAEIVDLVRQTLRDRGPLTELALAETLGLDEDDVSEALDAVSDDTVSVLLDGRLVLGSALLEDRLLTHRLTADEVAHDVLILDADLVVMLELGDTTRRLLSGDPLPVALPDLSPEPGIRSIPADVLTSHGVLVLPTGTFAAAGVSADNLLGVHVTTGGIDLRRLDPVELGDARPVQEALIGVLPPDQPSETGQSVLSVITALPEAFRAPVAPLSEIVAAGGLTAWGDYLGPPGFDLVKHTIDSQRSFLAETHHLSEISSLGLLALVRQFERVLATLGTDPQVDEAANVGAVEAVPLLQKPEVAEALRCETLEHGLDDGEGLGLLALVDLLEPHAGRPVRPALGWLRAKAYEALGETSLAEEELQRAERLGPGWPLTLLELARYASDRGDAVGGLALLRRADPWQDVDLQERLERFQPPAGPVVGRNDPCWCGSGRKFKQCHLNRPAELPLAERASWLYAKAGRYADDVGWWEVMNAAAEQRSAYAEDDEAVRAMMRDPLVVDAVLFEGGAFAEFLEVRGDLLPADERLLAEQWLLVDRSVFEVTAVRRGEGVTLRDLRTGDVHEVQERTASATLRPGHLICARVVPAGDTTQIFGGIEPVRPQERDELLALLDSEPEPDELVALLTRRFAPPEIVLSERLRQALRTEGPADVVAPDESAVRDAMTTYMADYEQQWLDLDIPALRGLTPRQAAADPTRREDLVQLLATFPETDDPTQMSADRLRVALGLT